MENSQINNTVKNCVCGASGILLSASWNGKAVINCGNDNHFIRPVVAVTDDKAITEWNALNG